MANFITESGIDFVADNVFYIEKSKQYTCLGADVQSVEFVRIKNDNLLFVEAKTTFPNPNNASAENFTKFQVAVKEICEKFIHSLNLLASNTIGVNEGDYPDDFVIPDNTAIVFVLVIKNHETKWCKDIWKSLMDALPLYCKRIWMPTVYVINHQTAIKRNLAVMQ